jgi:dTDP-4-dehydrorhamnose 3,5-epimerase-like enzyme
MKLINSSLPGVLIVEPTVFGDDRDIGETWPLTGEPVLSQKDRLGLPLREAQVFP